VTIDDERWQHCHASTVVVLDDAVLVAWFAGSAEGADDVGIWMARRDADQNWSDAERLDEGDPTPHWNPVLAVAPDGAIWLFYKRGHRISEWQTLVRTTTDGGRTWSRARELVRGDRGGRGPVKNPPVIVGERWFAPASTERWSSVPGEAGRWDAFIDVSDDGGGSWQRQDLPLDHSTCHGAGAIQPALWRNAAGGITALCRSSEGRALRSATLGTMIDSDDGPAFSPLTATSLPNNNSGLGAAALDVAGRRVVVCAHNPDGTDWGSRSTLLLSASTDDGRTWRRLGRIDGSEGTAENAEATPTRRPRGASDRGVDTDGLYEYSYPTVIVNDESLRISYTWQRRGIVLVTLPLAALNDLITAAC